MFKLKMLNVVDPKVFSIGYIDRSVFKYSRLISNNVGHTIKNRLWKWKKWKLGIVVKEHK